MTAHDPGPELRRPLFFGWVILNEPKWVTSRECRRKRKPDTLVTMNPDDETMLLIMTVCKLLGKDLSPPEVLRARAQCAKNLKYWKARSDYNQLIEELAQHVESD